MRNEKKNSSCDMSNSFNLIPNSVHMSIIKDRKITRREFKNTGYFVHCTFCVVVIIFLSTKVILFFSCEKRQTSTGKLNVMLCYNF